MAILPFGLPEPQSDTLRRLCQQVREAPGEAWSSGQAAKVCSMSERTLNRHFQQQTSLTWSEWVRRAKLMEALDSPGAGSLRAAGGAGAGLRQPQRFQRHVSSGDGRCSQRLFSPSDLIGDADRIAQCLQRTRAPRHYQYPLPSSFHLVEKRAADSRRPTDQSLRAPRVCSW